MIVENMTDLIGDTPLLKMPSHLTGLKNIDLYGKLEMLNPFGSVKDRVAWSMLKDDLESIKTQGQIVIENSSGNTAKALAAICGIYDIPFKQVSALMKVKEPRDVLRFLGVELEEFAAASDCFDPSDPNDPQFLIQKTVRESGGKVYFTSQFTNERNPDIHQQTTAQEILCDLGEVDYLVGGLGTTGSTLGLARAFKDVKKQFKCIGLVTKGGHMVPGIRSLDQMWESGLYQESKYDHTHVVDEKQALNGMILLNQKLGLLCGPSAGANFAGAVSYLKTIDADLTERKSAVFIVCDRMEWYMSYVQERMPELFGQKKNADGLFDFNEELSPSAPALPAEEDLSENLIIDIRSPMAFKLKSIPGSINIPIETFEKLVDGHDPFPKTGQILLVCAKGQKTPRYATYLQTRGYQIAYLDGGISAWQSMNAKLAQAA